MNYEDSRRSYLLPEGCKDLIDVIQAKTIQAKTAITEHGFVVTAQLPELQSRDIEIEAVGSTLRIFVKQSSSATPYVGAVEVPVPADYAIAQARATYLHGRLSIVVPKTTGFGALPVPITPVG